MTPGKPTPRRRILVVAYYYPPQNIIGARRPAALAKWLRRRGHDVTVLSSLQSARGPDPGPSRLVRTRDLLATRLNWRGQSLEAVTGRTDAAWDPDPGLWGSIFVPDVQLISWATFAVEAALRLHRRIGFDVVITTSPVESAHAAGLALQGRGVPWIADLRDGWRFEAPRIEWPLKIQRRLDGALERFVVRRAGAVVTVSEPLSADLRRRHGIAVETISNGFDPDDRAAAPVGRTDQLADPRKLTLVHTGGLGSQRTLRPLLEALARLGPDEADRVELVLAGAQTGPERALYADPSFVPFVRPLGFMPREKAMALQAAADVLVLVTSGVRTGEATGKLFEYLAAGRPILALAEGSAAADLVRAAGAGLVIPTHDTDAAEAALRRILAGGLPPPPPSVRAAFAYPALAERYEQVVERVISAGAGRTRA
jgi:glycosyltransferase involved in cell wall biosynthesis